ncbi:ABC transporter substrate-binding protein [Bdellovibrionota bacterium FG-1]
MEKKKKRIVFSAAGVILGITAVAFIGHGSATTKAPARRYVKALYAEPPSLDPAQMDDTASLLVSKLIYDGLLSFTANLDLHGAIAESWNTSPDGRTLHFKLRKRIFFQNGEAITPSDVVRSLTRVVAPNSKVFTYYDCIMGAEAFHQGKTASVAGLRAIGADQVEIVLKYPFPPFLSVLAGATAQILPREVEHPDFFKAPIGSGPFKYMRTERHERYTDIVLDRAGTYYADRPKIDEMVLRVMDESEAIKQAKAGLVDDLASFPLNGTEDVFAKGQHFVAPVAATWVVGLNTRLPPFDHISVRRAFRDSIDAENFRKTFHPDAVAAKGYIPPGLPGYQHSYRRASTPLQLQKRLKQHLIRIAIPEILARSQEMKLFFEQSLRAQGWNVEAVPMSWGRLMKGYSDKTLQAFLVSMNMDYPDTEFLVRNFESTNPDNFSGLHDEKTDALIRKARSTQDRVLRQNMYVDLVESLHDSAVTVDLFHPRGHYWAADCVRGFEPNILADVYIDYRAVSLEPGCANTKVAGL